MTYIFLYRTDNILLTEEQQKKSRQEWNTWNTFLNEVYGIRTDKGRIVSSDAVVDYNGNFKGASIIEAASLNEAVEIAKKRPNSKIRMSSGGT